MASEQQSTEPIATPDPTRSADGAWLLPGHLYPRVAEMQEADPALSLAHCFESLGAEWHDNLLYEPGHEPDRTMLHIFSDPIRTQQSVENATIWHVGGWMMNLTQKEEYDRLLMSNPTWTHTRCFRAAGGYWNFGVSQAVPPEVDAELVRPQTEATAPTQQ